MTLLALLAGSLGLLGAQDVRAEIRVGVAGPLTGSVQWLGEQQALGAERAVVDLNAGGGVLGQEVVIVPVDDACDEGQAVAAARQLVDEEVVFVNGHVCSHTSIAASKIYEDAGIVMISPASTNPRVTDEGGSNVFRVAGRDDDQGVVAGDYLADQWADGKIAILHDGQAYGEGLAKATKARLNERGVDEVLFEQYEPELADYTPLVDQMLSAGVDVLYVGGYANEAALILRQASERGAKLQLVSADAVTSDDFLIVSGEAGRGTLFTFGPDARENEAAAEVVASLREEEGYEPAGYTLYSYAILQAWAQAVEEAGSTDPDAVIAALRSGTFDTVLGEIGFDEKGDVTGVDTYVWYVWEDDQYVPVK
ncbi:MAG: branched-chain amino acid ABC transporter substrate-binding protein [Pseudomonadota bacterium]